MRPSNAIDDELVNLLCSLLKETAIIPAIVGCLLVNFAVFVFLLLCLCISLLLLLLLLDIHVHGREQSNHALKQQQDEVERVYLEFFEEAASQQPLVLELHHEGTLHVDTLQILHQADLLARVDLLVVFK